MMSFLRRLKAAWLFSQIHPHVPELKSDFWTEEDAKNHSKYMTSTTGKKWRLKMWRNVQDAGFRAIIERNYASYECGYASGCKGIMAVNDSLLQVPAQESESPTDNEADEEQAALLERFAP